jgi:hypothetical protein
MKLCRRTHCIWKPGQPVEGMVCHFVFSGAIPCTGIRRCIFCNRPEPLSCEASA